MTGDLNVVLFASTRADLYPLSPLLHALRREPRVVVTLLASGTVDFRINDNDLLASQTRTNSFGDHAHGTLTGLDGSSWNVTAQSRVVVLPSDDGTCHCVHVRSDIILVARG